MAARVNVYSPETWKRMCAPRRYGTHIFELKPESIKCVGYCQGAFYVSEYEWNDFSYVMRDTPWELTWIGSPGWFAYDECKAIYEWLAQRFDLTNFYEGDWMLLSEMESAMNIDSMTDQQINMIAPTDAELRALIENERAAEDKAEAMANQYEPELPVPANTNCTKCGEFCPSGTLENGLCNLCDLVGKIIYVKHWNLPSAKCRVTRISRNGTIYAQRYFVSLGTWSKERPVHYYKGTYHLGAKHKA